jgi:Ulp1 family protease
MNLRGDVKCSESDLNLLCGPDGEQWLNDIVIDLYLCYLREAIATACRNEQAQQSTQISSTHDRTHDSVEVFSCQFMSKIRREGISSTDRWYKQAKLFDAKFLLVPINHCNNHWSLLVASRNKSMTYYDSMGGSGALYFDQMQEYLSRQSRLRSGTEIDWNVWTTTTASDIPRQYNTRDCGVFVLQVGA